MTIYGTSVHFNNKGPRLRSHAILGKNDVMVESFFSGELILIKLHTCYDNIWDKFAFQHYRSKIKVTVAYGGGIHHFQCLSYFSVI